MGELVAHAFRPHGPAEVASSRRGDLPVLVAANGKRNLDTEVGQGAQLGVG